MSNGTYKKIFTAFKSIFPGGTESKNTTIYQYSDDTGAPYNSTDVVLHEVIDSQHSIRILDDGTKVTEFTIKSANGERVTVTAYEGK